MKNTNGRPSTVLARIFRFAEISVVSSRMCCKSLSPMKYVHKPHAVLTDTQLNAS